MERRPYRVVCNLSVLSPNDFTSRSYQSQLGYVDFDDGSLSHDTQLSVLHAVQSLVST